MNALPYSCWQPVTTALNAKHSPSHLYNEGECLRTCVSMYSSYTVRQLGPKSWNLAWWTTSTPWRWKGTFGSGTHTPEYEICYVRLGFWEPPIEGGYLCYFFFILSRPGFSSRTVWLDPQRWVVDFFRIWKSISIFSSSTFFLPRCGSATFWFCSSSAHLLDLFYDCRCKKMPRQRGPMV